MATHTTMSLYLGANDDGVRNGELIRGHAATKGMKRSEYVLYCVLEQIKREQEEKPHATAKSR
jgi:hypothetical protein